MPLLNPGGKKAQSLPRACAISLTFGLGKISILHRECSGSSSNSSPLLRPSQDVQGQGFATASAVLCFGVGVLEVAKYNSGRDTGIFWLHENLQRPLCEVARSSLCQDEVVPCWHPTRVWLVPGSSYWGWRSHKAIKARLQFLV